MSSIFVKLTRYICSLALAGLGVYCLIQGFTAAGGWLIAGGIIGITIKKFTLIKTKEKNNSIEGKK
jgi:multisubunit Na+/H+ antiporter MnhB subunit